MASNTYIKPKDPQKGSFFGGTGANKPAGSGGEANSPLRHLPYLLFLTFIGLIYIANNHYADDRLGKIGKLERDVKRMQVEYSTLKFEYMTAKTKEDIAKQLDALGLVPNDKPVVKIKLDK